MLYQEQPDGTGRISDGCNRDGSRAPHWCITGGLHPRSSVTLRLATTGHAARMPPAPHQCRAADFRAHRRSLRGVLAGHRSHRRHRTLGINRRLVGTLSAALRGDKPALSEIFLQQLIGIIHGTIRIDVSGGGGRYAGHSSLREIPNTLLITSESRAASPLS
jgi:hypothetical protein